MGERRLQEVKNFREKEMNEMANTEQDPGFGYEAKIWKKNDPLAEADINHMELGIENAHGTLNKYILGRSTKQHFNINAA